MFHQHAIEVTVRNTNELKIIFENFLVTLPVFHSDLNPPTVVESSVLTDMNKLDVYTRKGAGIFPSQYFPRSGEKAS